MPRFIVTAITFLLTVFLLNTGYAAVKKKAPAVLRTDTSVIQVKHFDAKAITKYKADKDFNYTDGAGVGQESFWDRFWSWVWNKLFGWIGRTRYGATIFEYVLLAAGVFLLVFVIFKSLGIDPIGMMRGEAKKIELGYSESLENIHEINFDDEIEKAIAQNNYRLAVRLLYLKCLKQLSDTHLIHWQIDKTNAAYIHELSDPEQKQIFGIITRQFEYVWYGNFIIDKQAFGNINQLFQNFKKQLP